MSMRDNIPKMPMIYWGSKRRVVTTAWRAFGNIAQIIEPFAGSAAVSLAHPPEWDGIIILNDADGLLVNALRALVHKPDETAYWADWPQTESDLHARHIWLVGQRDRLTSRLEGDPTWCDPQAAGWWLWGTAVWLGGRWCSGDGDTDVDLAANTRSSSGGYNSTSRSDGAQVRRHYEGLWLSPHCVAVDQPRLFEALPPVAVPGPDNPSGGSDTTI